MQFELFVAARYLRAKRRQAVIGIITVISVIGVAAGVASLIIALAINNGFPSGSSGTFAGFNVAHQPVAGGKRRHSRLAKALAASGTTTTRAGRRSGNLRAG